MQNAMPNSDVKDMEDSGKAPRVRRLDPTKKTVPDVFYYKTLNQINKPKLRQPLPIKPIFTGAELDALADGLANHTLEPTQFLVTKQSSIPKKKVDLKEFTCFGRLPIELRLKIWKHARPGPRIVRLAWSKHEPEPSRYYEIDRNCFRANFSRVPIPAMLHACSESRRVALKWYRLALQPLLAKPRTYFDFSSDYLFPGCEECRDDICRKCQNMVNPRDKHAVERILYPGPADDIPFFDIYLHFRTVKEILIFDSATDPLQPDVQLSHLKETEKPFTWQVGKELYATFLEEMDKLNARYMQYIDQFDSDLEYTGSLQLTDEEKHRIKTQAKIVFHPDKITRVELALPPEA